MFVRSNLEAMTMAVVMALLLKGFIVEAFKIPTGSMQPTLIGDERGQVFDRILVDKLSYRLRDPERWEVAIFRYPLDRSKNYVKRIAGVGPEDVKIQNGDLFRRASDDEPWAIQRRPRAVQETAWKTIDRHEVEGPSWRVASAGSGWKVRGREIEARGSGRAEFLPEQREIRDYYLDGYGEPLRGLVHPRPSRSGRNPVGDLRVDGDVRALAGTERVSFELFEGARRYLFRIPGPAASADDCPTITAVDEENGERREMHGEPYRLAAAATVRVRAQNMDDLLELQIDGRWVLALEVDGADDQLASVVVTVEGEGADVSDLMVYRDIYYTGDSAKEPWFRVPAGQYFMLGDNTQDSSDSRDWSFTRFQVRPGDGEPLIVQGDTRRGENPLTVFPAEMDGPLTFFEDEWGEKHWFRPGDADRMSSHTASFVPRDKILGRAVAVFWPLQPWRDIVRLRWVH